MQTHPNATTAAVPGLVRTPYTPVVCLAWGHERIHAARQQTSCPGWGASARRSFAVFGDLREEQR